ncbi:alanyl-tRNA editing protein AlaX-L [Clostridium bornimense]|uniref:DHHA1 domain-containing protein n=1 Tax=Clostridium bornimense TaxID=1216932 RepID=UPI001C125598|nr:DHHA1 domain-containing protein [Clostridium bornimense]MBU5315739.1 alanyl-tRNA editing protein AlaX-L [Clostridium bornimense]
MKKLFYIDPYIKEFTAEILEIKEIDNKFHVVLDQTAFFPGGGGQCGDLGFIENHKVIDVYEADGTIYHVVETKPIKIHKVKCSIDWDRRFDGMQQHLGQHVLSGCFYKLFNANTFAIHLGTEISTVDIEGTLTEEQVREAEKYANEVISEGLTVEFLIPTKKELKSLTLRRALPNTKEDISVVKIGDLDINACCGVHPRNTRDLRMIKIKKYEKHKQGTRIEFLSGNRAVADSLKKDNFANIICKYLNCNEDEVINGIKNLNASLKDALDENKKIKNQLATYEIKELINEADTIDNMKVLKKIYTDETVKYVNTVISKVVENDNMVTLMAVVSGDKVNLIFACSKNLKNVKVNEILKDAITLIDGRGGGSPFLAQGGGKNNGNLENALNYAFNKLKK